MSEQLALTPKELECLHMAALDKSLMETAELLRVSARTVKKHRSCILHKMHCKTMVGALAAAMKNNLIKF